jgi:formate hydrogenlyase transcriptional activator
LAKNFLNADEMDTETVVRGPFSGNGRPNGQTDHKIIGGSSRLRAVLERIDIVAPTNSTVLLCGETGSGKEVLAHAIHERSLRKTRRFVKVNCAAIPSGLLESELFGHEKGAFTGALTRKIGRFELAHSGTLLLDEIGDIPMELQPKLLRVVQDGEFERLGSCATIRTDVRLVAATHRDLPWMVQHGAFRADLFYRLNVFPIPVPPLRDRIDDVPMLVRHFVHLYADRMNKRVQIIPLDVLETLMGYHWPGNVRELQNLIERAVILMTNGIFRLPPDEWRSPSITPVRNLPSRIDTLKQIEKDCILRSLEEADWVVGGKNGAAARLGLPRTTLIYKMRKLGITRNLSSSPPSRAGAA